MAYLISYLLLAGALLRLVVASTTKRITLITALDSLSIMLSCGTLIWYFFFGAPSTPETHRTSGCIVRAGRSVERNL